VLDYVPDLIPYPYVARDLFKSAELGVVVLGLLIAIILYRQSRKRGYTGLFWSRWLVRAIIAFAVLLFGYLVLFYSIDTPPVALMYFEAFLFFCLYFILILAIALIVMLAPPSLMKFIKSHWGGGPPRTA
jgi:hypothetical protein